MAVITKEPPNQRRRTTVAESEIGSMETGHVCALGGHGLAFEVGSPKHKYRVSLTHEEITALWRFYTKHEEDDED